MSVDVIDVIDVINVLDVIDVSRFIDVIILMIDD